MTTLRKLLLLSVVIVAAGGFVGIGAKADDSKASGPAPVPSGQAAPADTAAPSAPAPAAADPAPGQAAGPAPTDDGKTAKPGAEAAAPPPSPTVDVADLMSPPPLPEIAMGDANAPITIVEYHSMTCPHCAHFEKTVLPTLEEKYVKTGKVRYIMRSFPLNQLDAVAFMMLRCQPTVKYLASVKYMYDNQESWAFTQDPQTAVNKLARTLGFTQETFEACLHDQSIWDGLEAIAKKADTVFQVDGTPTFFINGKRQPPIGSPEDLDKVLAPFVKS